MMLKTIVKFLDDLLFAAGIASMTYAGFLYGDIVGFAVLGACLVAYGLLIARNGGDPDC